MEYYKIANSTVMLVLCSIVILIVVLQAIIFIRKAISRGKELGMDESIIKPTIKNSVLLSIVPSLPVIVLMLALSVPLGRYFPWLRLSVVGGAAYEGIAANIGAQSVGLEDISDPNLTPDHFIIIAFIMTIGIVGGMVFNILFMKQIDKAAITARNKAMRTGSKGFLTIFSAALLVAMLAVISTPYVLNTQNIEAIIAFLSSGFAVLGLNKLADKLNKSALKEFSFTIALLIGIGAVIVYTNLF